VVVVVEEQVMKVLNLNKENQVRKKELVNAVAVTKEDLLPYRRLKELQEEGVDLQGFL